MPEDDDLAWRHERSLARPPSTADGVVSNQPTVERGLSHARHIASEDTSRAGRSPHSQREIAHALRPPAPRPPSLLAWRDRARPQRAPHDNRSGSPPLARYVAEDPQAYTLLDLASGEEVRVLKRRAAPEVFPPTRKTRALGAGLLRASGYALLGALLGGAPGIVLGLIVTLVALMRLSGFERRTHSWRRARAPRQDLDPGEALRLPAEATNERLRLMTALWQGLGGLVLGGITLLLLLIALR